MEFPEHKGSLIITHNDHTTNYETVKEMISRDSYYEDGWISEEDRQLCIDNNSIWTVHWYPETPIGFYVVHASSFELALKYANKEQVMTNHAENILAMKQQIADGDVLKMAKKIKRCKLCYKIKAFFKKRHKHD